MQTGCPHELLLVAEARANRFFEKAVHGLFIKQWVRGEWFRETDLLTVFIGTLHLAQSWGADLNEWACGWSRHLTRPDRLPDWLTTSFYKAVPLYCVACRVPLVRYDAGRECAACGQGERMRTINVPFVCRDSEDTWRGIRGIPKRRLYSRSCHRAEHGGMKFAARGKEAA